MAWAHVQTVDNDAQTGATVTLSVPSVGAGHLLVGAVTWDSSGGITLSSVKDDLANTFTIGDNIPDATDNQACASFYFPNESSGTRTLTFTFSASTNFVGSVCSEYSGIATTSPNVGHNGANQIGPGTGANILNSGNITTSGNGDLIWGMAFSVGGATTLTAGTSPNAFTSRLTGGTSTPHIVEDFLQTTAGTIAATVGSNTNVNCTTFVLGFKLPSTFVPASTLPLLGVA